MPSKNKAIETEPRSRFPSVRSEVESEQDDEIKLHFSVTDTGIGIPLRQLDRVFETFPRADASIARRYGGTGLGLPISSRLVHIMGAHLG